MWHGTVGISRTNPRTNTSRTFIASPDRCLVHPKTHPVRTSRPKTCGLWLGSRIPRRVKRFTCFCPAVAEPCCRSPITATLDRRANRAVGRSNDHNFPNRRPSQLIVVVGRNVPDYPKSGTRDPLERKARLQIPDRAERRLKSSPRCVCIMCAPASVTVR